MWPPSRFTLSFRFAKPDGVIVETFGGTKWLRKGERKDEEEGREGRRRRKV